MHRRLTLCLLFPALLSALALIAPTRAHAADGAWNGILNPGNRMSHTLTADPARSRTLLFGGWDGNGFLNNAAYHNDVWVLDLSGTPMWSPMSTTGGPPPPRVEHVAVLDPVRNRMIVFGGKTGNTYYNDLWALDLVTGAWSTIEAAGTPPSPMETRAIYDPVRDRLVFFGGYHPVPVPGTGAVTELRELTLSGTPTWNDLTAAGTEPPARAAHTLIYDPFGDRMLVFGGWTGTSYIGDLWELSLSGTPTWTQLGGGPPNRYGHSAIFDPLRLRMVVFGGFHDGPNTFLDDVWAYDLTSPAWTALNITGTPPSPRDFQAMAFDEANDRAALMGGNNFLGVSSNTWMIDFDIQPTAVLVSTGAPEAAPDRVRLRWHASEINRDYQVHRSADATVWTTLGKATATDGGWLVWDDTDVEPGRSYSYRLSFADGGAMRNAGDVRVTVPRAYVLQLSAQPVVRERGFTVELTMPAPGEAQIDVFDVRGRRVEGHTETFGAGRHTIDMGSTVGWYPGVYWVRVQRAGETAQRRVVVLR